MKNIVFTLVLAMISSIATAQTDLSQLKQNDKNEYLVRVSKEMIKEIAPDYLEDCKTGEISGPIEFTEKTGKDMGLDEGNTIKYIGKKYYLIDYSVKYTSWDMEMIGHIVVRIWEYNGEPLSIFFNIGGGIGIEFISSPYKDLKETPKESYQQHK